MAALCHGFMPKSRRHRQAAGLVPDNASAYWRRIAFAQALGWHWTTLLSGQYPDKFNWLSSMTYTELLAV